MENKRGCRKKKMREVKFGDVIRELKCRMELWRKKASFAICSDKKNKSQCRARKSLMKMRKRR